MKYTLGADPELFMMDDTGKLRASCGLIGGSKHHPQPMGLGDGFFIQEDNVAVEFNIPPSPTAKEFRENLRKAVGSIAENIQKMYKFELVNLSAALFPEDQLESPAAQEFGCDPDYNAWTQTVNPRPCATDKTLRSCGGHVHVGLQYPERISPYVLTRAMDLFLGVPSVLMDRGELRKSLYGKAGACRIKSYGVEYRTLSNFWIFDDKFIDWVWKGVGRSIAVVEAQLMGFMEQDKDLILKAINDNDKAAAAALVQKHNLEVVHV